MLARDTTNAARNVFGQPLMPCSVDPVTGFYRDGCCNSVQMTADFLAFSRARGNDLSTPVPEYGFAGLKPGDQWCLCAARWQEAYQAGFAPKVVLLSTHERALEVCDFIALKAHAIDLV